MEWLTILFSVVVVDNLTLTDVGTGAVVGALLGETFARLASSMGWEWQADSWREGMFFGGLLTLIAWLFGEVGA